MSNEGLIIIFPALLICGGFWIWSHFLRSPRLVRAIRFSAVFWAILILSSYVLLGIAVDHCGGNILYGFGTCTLMPQATPTIMTLVLLGALAMGGICAVILLGVGFYMSWQNRS